MSLSCQKLTLQAIFCSLLSLQAMGQSHIDSLAGQFIKSLRAGRKEKIIVLTDKSFYAAGENIWLKAWCLDSLSNRFLYASKNMFVDLVDDKDSVISQLLFNIPEHKTAGTILLPGSLHEGYYWLRAYTTRILREDSNRIFVKPVYVVNTNNPDPHSLSAFTAQRSAVREDTAAPVIRFFPEGGSIIAGTTATVAFRSTGSGGEPLDVTGYVTDPLRDTVARFATTLPGLGRFSFDAYNPRKYTAHILWRGREVLYPLPLIDQYADQLSLVSQDDRSLRLRVSQGDSLYKKHKVTRILGISRDSLCFAATGTDMYEVNVPKSNFPPGKATFLLWDDRDRIVSERSVYMTGTDSGGIVAATDKAGYAPGEKVNLNIGVKPQGDNGAIEALLAVSVTDDRATGNNLSVAVSAAGLPEVDDALPKRYTPEQADLLMLEQPPLYGGRAWGPPGPPSLHSGEDPDSNLLNLRGKVVDKSNAPMKHYVVNLLSSGSGFFMADTTDEEGRFLFPLTDYNDGTQFTVKITDMKGKGHEGLLILDKFAFPQFPTPRRLKQGLSPAGVAMVRRFRAAQLAEPSLDPKNGYLKPATVESSADAGYDQSKRVSPFSHIITSSALKSGGIDVVLNAISNVPGFSTAMNREFVGNSGGSASSTSQPVLVLVDGAELSSNTDLKSYFESIDATNIDFIEVLTGPQTALYGVEGGGGVVLINTLNKIKEVAQVNDKGTTTIYPKGYYSQPDSYAAGGKPSSTLYWNANVLTDSRGNAKVNFLTGRQQATYSAAIVGITRNGEIVSGKVEIRCQ